jgi:hypothetical protein
MSLNKDLYEALSRAQAKVENAKRGTTNPHFNKTYADLATVWDTIREPLTSEGLSVLQLPCEAPAGHVGLLTIIGHKSGQTVQEKFFLQLKKADNPQDAGSCLTYMKRYALMGVAGIAPEDDDGNAAAGKPSPAAPAVDYSATIAETMKHLEKATDEEARALYATVRNSGMQQAAKDGLLKQMYDVIQARMAKQTEEPKGKKK